MIGLCFELYVFQTEAKMCGEYFIVGSNGINRNVVSSRFICANCGEQFSIEHDHCRVASRAQYDFWMKDVIKFHLLPLFHVKHLSPKRRVDLLAQSQGLAPCIAQIPRLG